MPLPKTQAGPSCLTAYLMIGEPQTEAFKNSRLRRKDGSSPFSILTIGMKGGGADKGSNAPVAKDQAFILESGTLTRDKTPVGWFDFVITVEELNVAYVRRSREAKMARGKTDPGMDRGHSSIAKGGAVVFAGELLFGGETYLQKRSKEYAGSKPGELVRWTNKTGHYYVGAQFGMSGPKLVEHVFRQTDLLRDDSGARMLPIDLFEPWDGEI